MSFSYPSSTRLLLCIQSISSRTPECFRFHPWSSSPAEWRCTPDRRRLYGMLWGKPPAEWCSSAKFSSHVCLFPVPIFGVNNNIGGQPSKITKLQVLLRNGFHLQARPDNSHGRSAKYASNVDEPGFRGRLLFSLGRYWSGNSSSLLCVDG
jgi:hypothetical protein